MAVILKNGVKRTVTSTWPAALVVDTQILAAAPPAMTAAGFGEMMSMFTAPADWRLAAMAGVDASFDPGIVGLFRPRGEALLAAAPALRQGDETALTLLARLLTASGLAMGAAGRTAPLSGMEHLVSHLIDMSAEADGRRVGLHGAQVGVAALLAACLWERLLDRLEPGDFERTVPDEESMRREIATRFARARPEREDGRRVLVRLPGEARRLAQRRRAAALARQAMGRREGGARCYRRQAGGDRDGARRGGCAATLQRARPAGRRPSGPAGRSPRAT